MYVCVWVCVFVCVFVGGCVCGGVRERKRGVEEESVDRGGRSIVKKKLRTHMLSTTY